MLCQCFILAGILLWMSEGAYVMEQVEKSSRCSPKEDGFG